MIYGIKKNYGIRIFKKKKKNTKNIKFINIIKKCIKQNMSRVSEKCLYYDLMMTGIVKKSSPIYFATS